MISDQLKNGYFKPYLRMHQWKIYLNWQHRKLLKWQPLKEKHMWDKDDKLWHKQTKLTFNFKWRENIPRFLILLFSRFGSSQSRRKQRCQYVDTFFQFKDFPFFICFEIYLLTVAAANWNVLNVRCFRYVHRFRSVYKEQDLCTLIWIRPQSYAYYKFCEQTQARQAILPLQQNPRLRRQPLEREREHNEPTRISYRAESEPKTRRLPRKLPSPPLRTKEGQNLEPGSQRIPPVRACPPRIAS